MIWWWLAPCLVAVVAGAYALGWWRGNAPSREEREQDRLEALAMGRDPKDNAATVERAVVRPARIARSHPYDPPNNGNI
jgi:hypothetical protein